MRVLGVMMVVGMRPLMGYNLLIAALAREYLLKLLVEVMMVLMMLFCHSFVEVISLYNFECKITNFAIFCQTFTKMQKITLNYSVLQNKNLFL